MTAFLRRAGSTYILIAVFVTMLTLGLLWGGFGKVLTNGVFICLDCIGLI